jgi:predicted dehydrogenase
VDITLPTPIHPQAAVKALQAGKNVLIEKPLALSMPEVDSILAAAQDSSRFLMVGHVLRFWPEYLAIRRELQSGRLGAPQSAVALRLSSFPQWSGWFRDPQATGGAVLDLHIHDVDLLNWLFGKPERVFASGVQSPGGGWDHVITQLEYAQVRASAEASFRMPNDFPFTAGLRVQCEGGVIEYHHRAVGGSFEQGRLQSFLYRHEPGRPNQPVEVEGGDAFEAEIAYFVNCVQNNQAPDRVTPIDARLAVQTCLAARCSLETATPVRVADIH